MPGWHCRVYDAKVDRQVQKTFYGTERQAIVFIESFRAEQAAKSAPQIPSPRDITVAQWSVEFLRRYRWKIPPLDGEGGVARPKTTWNNAKANLSAYIVPGLRPETRLWKVTYDDCFRLIATLKLKDGKTPADPDTKDKAASILRLMFKEAARASIIEVNPAAELPSVWGDRGRRARVVIPLKQVEDLAAAMDAEWGSRRGDIVRAFAFSGPRWENLAGVKLEDIDLERRSIWIGRSVPASTGEVTEVLKGSGDDYYITIIDELVAPLTRLMQYAVDHGSAWLLCGVRGGRLSYGLWRKHLDRARRSSGVPYTAHGLRHVCASMLIAGGAPIERVREQMGHASTKVTERVYRHAIQIDRRDLAKSLRLPTTGIEVDDSAESSAA